MKKPGLVEQGLISMSLLIFGANTGCSNESPIGASGQTEPLAIERLASSQVDASAASPGRSQPKTDGDAIVFSAPAGTVCIIHPQGRTGNSTQQTVLQADGDDEICFYPPPDDWGTELTLDCIQPGTIKNTSVLDLNVPSTHKRKSQSELALRQVGVRAALVGDLSSIPISELLSKGYPPRPDPIHNPERFAEWKQAVSTPVVLFDAKPVAILRSTANGYVDHQTSGNWTGYLQDSQGFTQPNPPTIYDANYGANYTLYQALIQTPFYTSCPPGNCNTALWAGIGGYPTLGYGQPDLIQSGFQMNGSQPFPFFEYTPAAEYKVSPPSGQHYNYGDSWYFWGYSSYYAGNPANLNNNWDVTGQHGGAYACFGFQDNTQGFAIVPTSNWWGYYNLCPFITGGFFYGSTAEYIVENEYDQNNLPYNNTPYFSKGPLGLPFPVTMTGFAIDGNLAPHYDPSSGADPYLALWQTKGAGTAVSLIGGLNGSTYTAPQSALTFTWNTY